MFLPNWSWDCILQSGEERSATKKKLLLFQRLQRCSCFTGFRHPQVAWHETYLWRSHNTHQFTSTNCSSLHGGAVHVSPLGRAACSTRSAKLPIPSANCRFEITHSPGSRSWPAVWSQAMKFAFEDHTVLGTGAASCELGKWPIIFHVCETRKCGAFLALPAETMRGRAVAADKNLSGIHIRRTNYCIALVRSRVTSQVFMSRAKPWEQPGRAHSPLSKHFDLIPVSFLFLQHMAPSQCHTARNSI